MIKAKTRVQNLLAKIANDKYSPIKVKSKEEKYLNEIGDNQSDGGSDSGSGSGGGANVLTFYVDYLHEAANGCKLAYKDQQLTERLFTSYEEAKAVLSNVPLFAEVFESETYGITGMNYAMCLYDIGEEEGIVARCTTIDGEGYIVYLFSPVEDK